MGTTYFNVQNGVVESTPLKAVVAGLVQLVTLLAMAWYSGDVDGIVIEEAVSAFVLSLVGAGFVWAAPYFKDTVKPGPVVPDDSDPGSRAA
jgi:hypothetical protein